MEDEINEKKKYQQSFVIFQLSPSLLSENPGYKIEGFGEAGGMLSESRMMHGVEMRGVD